MLGSLVGWGGGGGEITLHISIVVFESVDIKPYSFRLFWKLNCHENSASSAKSDPKNQMCMGSFHGLG